MAKRRVRSRRQAAARERSGGAERRDVAETAAGDRILDACCWLAILALVFAAYANALDGAFVYDDKGSIVENPAVHWRELGVEPLRAAWLESPTRRVVANWSFGLTWFFVRDDPWAYHATNILVHALSSCLVFALALGLLRRARELGEGAEAALPASLLRPAAFVAAAFFATHPLQTQAVSYVVQRMAGFAGFFSLLSLWAYTRGRERADAARVRWWATAALSWLLAVASKENAATFPAVVWCYEWIFHRSADARWARRSVAWVSAAGVPMVALMFFNYPDPFRDYLFHDFGVVDRLLSLPRVFLYYASLIGLPLPSRLVLMHDFEASSGLFEPPMTALALAALAALVFMALRRLRSEPIIAFAALWFAITLSVESTIFPLRLVHEHRLYLPLAGIAFAVARAGVGLGALAPRLAVVAAGVAIVALATGTHVRNRVWHDGETLWADVVAKSPGAAIGPMNLGVIYAERGERDRATALFQRAIEADPDFGGPYRAIATQKFEAGRTAEAIPLFEKAARLDPLDHYAFGQLGIALYTSGRAEKSLHYFRESLRIKPADRIVNHYGKALFALGRVDEAIAQHRRALMMDPDYAYAHLALGVAEARRGRSREARAAFDRALSIEPLVDAHIELANLDWQQGRARAAVERLRGVIAREPRRFVAANNLAWFLATTADSELSDPEEALGLVAVARGGTVDAGLLDTQAAAQAAAGDYRAALETATAAIALAREAGNTRLVVALEERADSYRAGRRWIDPVTERATDAGP